MGCMFKCISYVFGAGPPRSLDLLGVGNPGKKRQLGIGTVLQYPMICTSKKHDDISSTSLVITVIYVYYSHICILHVIYVCVVVVVNHQHCIHITHTVHVITLPNNTIEPENDGFQKDSPIPGADFQVPC